MVYHIPYTIQCKLYSVYSGVYTEGDKMLGIHTVYVEL